MSGNDEVVDTWHQFEQTDTNIVVLPQQINFCYYDIIVIMMAMNNITVNMML
jgi:hypothetical protein